jgi:hypoxanthine phosphoribosyltransferase|tara:strand:+ start:296 stop:706 length:411 start_codon:yes stop_codon:yes gene_type:complete
MLENENKRYITWDQMEGLVNKLATIIKNHLMLNPLSNIDSIYGIPRGGSIPAVMLSHKLGIPYSEKITLTSLIVDDICDSGVTLKEWEGYTTAVLLFKPHTSCAVPTLYGSTHNSDEWIVFPWERNDSNPIQDYKI